VSRAFDVAWFFHCSPAELLGLDVDEFLHWEAQAFRIAEAQRDAREDTSE
jgi:Phage P2 GpE